MINIENGDLQFENIKLIIKKGLTRDEFMQSDLFYDVLNQDDYGYVRYYIKPQTMCEQKFVIALLFKPDKLLSSVTLGLAIDGAIPTWENWSEEEELRKKVLLAKWLEKNLGESSYDYTWGSIILAYDRRSASSHITIYYN